MEKLGASTGRRVGLTKEAVIATAVAMSEQHGIDGWSMRSLAQELGIAPSVLYHYFSAKDEVCDGVVDTIIATIALPKADLPWKEWFTQILHNARPALLKYHGVTERLQQGKFTPSALPMLDAGVMKLQEAGFGKYTALAFVMIVNVAIGAISARNMRSHHGSTTPHHDIHSMLERLTPMSEQSIGLSLMIDSMFTPLTLTKEDQLSAAYFDLIIAAILDGMEHVVLPLATQ